MHLREIDFLCGQAAIRVTMLGEQNVTIARVTEILDRHRSQIRRSPVLFGGAAKS
jgi:hypothetical protein